MTIKKMYRYRGEGGTVDTTVLLPLEHEDRLRISPDSGKIITNGEVVVDDVYDIPAADLDKWSEIDAPVEGGEGE